MTQTVYVLQNPAFCHLLKIGRTTGRVCDRVRQLTTTGVPKPFEIAFAGRVNDCNVVERAVHAELRSHRVNDRREFFQIELDAAMQVIRPLIIEDVTEFERASTPGRSEPQDEIAFGYLEEGQALLDGASSRRTPETFAGGALPFPHIDFMRMGLSIGDKLLSVLTPAAVIVDGPKHVRFEGERMSLTRATQRIKATLGADPKAEVQYPTRYWHFNGVSLRQIYALAFGAPMLPLPKRPARSTTV